MIHKENGRMYLKAKSSGYEIITSFDGVFLPEVPGWTWILYAGEPRLQHDNDVGLLGYITDMRDTEGGFVEVDFFHDNKSDPTDTIFCNTIEEAVQRLVIWAQLGGY